jgi:hypothetical protein
MVFDTVGAVQTGFAGLFDDGQKMAKLGVFQHARQIAGKSPKSRTDPFPVFNGIVPVKTKPRFCVNS